MYKEDVIYCLGGVIKSARLERHLTQKESAERLSIMPHYLLSIENKRKLPSCDLLFRIIHELEISADTIFYLEYGRDNALLKKLEIC
ncbi:MAG: helix-turn-helix domain-containing protein [Clostridiales bacterium]|jgi:transcriptional regulator with XRE-family HTH domain|nr:helix-turn-helix domain-containing protein [Clostridiales bacterium]